MVVHRLGGVYADADTQCRVPIEAWAPRHCQFAVSIENEVHFCQWAFAAVPGHPALASVIDIVIKRMFNQEEHLKTDDHVHLITGPGAFTDGILYYLGLSDGGGGRVNLTELVEVRGDELAREGICLMTHEEMQLNLLNFYSSQNENLMSESWVSWLSEEENLRQKNSSGGLGTHGGGEEGRE
jgi:hypothetical protein